MQRFAGRRDKTAGDDGEQMAQVFFVSGHLDLTAEEFEREYVPQLEAALRDCKDASFVVGDAKGGDSMAQAWLATKGVRSVRVFHKHGGPRCNKLNWPTTSGFRTDEERDAALTAASTVDIAWARSVDEQKRLYGDKYYPRVSGTQKNLERRQRRQQQGDTS